MWYTAIVRQQESSMRLIYPRCIGKVKTLTPRPLRPSRCLNAGARVSTSVALRRYQSSIDSPEWTRHTLSSLQVFPNDMSELPKGSPPVLAYIAFGSNLGDRIDWIERACNEMAEQGIRILRTSCLWETDPMYVVDQDKFVNGVCEVETTLEPMELLDTLQGIERSLGREKLIDKGPRNIDLDILLYGQEVVDTYRLKIPHALMFEREFVLRPLAELIPGKSLNPTSPWTTTVDYLNALPPSSSPMSTLTPLGPSQEPIRSLLPNRKTLVMAIFNFTPDSFSNDKKDAPNADLDLSTLHLTLTKGYLEADIIDVGGQSSAPKAMEITAEEEIQRTVPAIKVLRGRGEYRGIISIDTYRASVAEAAVNAGADIINDISAGNLDEQMLPTMARLGKTVCLMHMRGTPMSMQHWSNIKYKPKGLIPSIAEELLERVAAAEAAGIRRWRIILDPGIGFAKTSEHNLEILRSLEELRYWPGLEGLPWLVGSSRKHFIEVITGDKNPKERIWGTAATVAAAVQGGADIIRVHDVRGMSKVAKMSDAIWRV
ncbi:Folic acid synthesis protein fol1 [Lachnellula suecica]|uniref:Folic acid synthesis protein FOL1 n=1 Tax=Lachnellula suecica TaxID=602035 RepID=A0A8T9CK16_9HELO|nr:Folic acid synthesis protein fol1 [Lachnellula suecica]